MKIPDYITPQNLLEKYPHIANEQLHISPLAIMTQILELPKWDVRLTPQTKLNMSQIAEIDDRLDSVRALLVYTLRVYYELIPRLSGTPLASENITIIEFLRLAQNIKSIDAQIQLFGDTQKLARLAFFQKYIQTTQNHPIPAQVSTSLQNLLETLISNWNELAYWESTNGLKPPIPMAQLFTEQIKWARVTGLLKIKEKVVLGKYRGLIRQGQKGTVREKSFEIITRFQQIYPNWKQKNFGYDYWETADAAVMLVDRKNVYNFSFFPLQFKICELLSPITARPLLIPELVQYLDQPLEYPDQPYFSGDQVKISKSDVVSVFDPSFELQMHMEDYLTALIAGTIGLEIEQILWFPSQALAGIFVTGSDWVILVGGEKAR